MVLAPELVLEDEQISAAEPILRVESVCKEYANGTLALDNTTFEVMPGELVSIVGASGCGKSTLLRIIAGLGDATEGSVLVDGLAPGPGALDRRRDEVRVSGADAAAVAVHPGNVELPVGLQGVGKKQRYEAAMDALSVVGLSGSEDMYPPLVCAGISDIGRKFTIEEADACLVSSHGQEGFKDLSKHVHDIARDMGKKTNTIALIMVVPGSTNSEAMNRVNRYNAAADMEALNTVAAAYGMSGSSGRLSTSDMEGKAVGMMSGYPLAGSAEGIIDLFTDLFENGELDGLVLTVPDFIDDLEFLGEKVMPIMKARGFTRQMSVQPALV